MFVVWQNIAAFIVNRLKRKKEEEKQKHENTGMHQSVVSKHI